MSRFLDAESNGGIFIDITCSEPNILTCKVIVVYDLFIIMRQNMRLVPIYRYATIYIFSKQRRFYLYIYTCGLQNWSLKRDFYKDFNGIISKTK